VNSITCSAHKTFEDYKDQKACYRFLSNENVKESILIEQIRRKCASSVSNKNVIAICDTSVINTDSHWGRISDHEGLGSTGRNQKKASHGFFVHPITVFASDSDAAYGLADIHVYNREMTPTNLNRVERNRESSKLPIEQKETYKWVGPCEKAKQTSLKSAKHITFLMDREGDIWDVYRRLPDERTDIIVRCKHDRCIINSKGKQTKLFSELQAQKPNEIFEITIKNKNKKNRKLLVEMKIGHSQIVPSHKNSSTELIKLSYVEITQIPRKNETLEDPVHWILWTNKPINSTAEGKTIIKTYQKRWRIEVFFKLIKSDGFDIENTQLESGRAIRKLTIIIMDAAMKILQLKAARAGDTDLRVDQMFTEKEIECLKSLNKRLDGNTAKQQNPHPIKNLAWASWIIARLAGWTEFYDDKRPPGNKTFKRGLDRFESIMIGYDLSG